MGGGILCNYVQGWSWSWWTGSWVSRQSLSNLRPIMWSRVVSDLRTRLTDQKMLFSEWAFGFCILWHTLKIEKLKVTLQSSPNHVVQIRKCYHLSYLLVSYVDCRFIHPPILGFSASNLACRLFHPSIFWLPSRPWLLGYGFPCLSFDL